LIISFHHCSVCPSPAGDFGLARTLKDSFDYAQTHVGTPFYMSPEQVLETAYNAKSDIWSLGCLIYELAALKPPFNASNHLALATKIRAGVFERIPARYSDELQRVIRQMIQVDQARRPSVSDILKHPRIAARIKAEKDREDRRRSLELQQKQMAAAAAARPATAAPAPAPAASAPDGSCPSCAANSASMAHAQRSLREEAAALAKRAEELTRREAAFAEEKKAMAERERKVREREAQLDKREMQMPRPATAASQLSYRAPLQQLNLNGPTYSRARALGSPSRDR
jgi:hypothetical protein